MTADPTPEDTEAAAVWERLTGAQIGNLARRVEVEREGGSNYVTGFVDARVANHLAAKGLVSVYMGIDGIKRAEPTELGRRVAAHGRKAGAR